MFIIRVVHSPFGQVLKAIRENEPRAISLGYDVSRYKLLAFVLSLPVLALVGSWTQWNAGRCSPDAVGG